jgi:tetratricopeptide (TPR) repeat protein
LAGSQILADRLAVIANAMNGFVALQEGNYSDCSRRFSAVLDLLDEIEVSSNRAEGSHSALAICLAALGQQEAARDHYLAALEANPDYALAHYGLGNYYYGRLDYEVAQRYYELTIEKSAIDPLATEIILGRAYVGLGNIAIAGQDYEAAVEALNRAIVIEPDLPGYYLARAIAWQALGRAAEAEADLNRCLELAAEPAEDQSDYYRQLEEECRSLLEGPANENLSAETATAETIPATSTKTPTIPATPAAPTPTPVAGLTSTPTQPPTVPPPTSLPTQTQPPPTEPPTVPPPPPTSPPPPPTTATPEPP